MRINEPTGQFGDSKAHLGKAKKSGSRNPAKHVDRDMVHNANFTKQLDTAAEEQLKLSLDKLIEELAEQAKVLEKKRTFAELDRYKKLVKSFMEEVIKKIFTIKISDSSKLMAKRKKVYIIVEQVDGQLEALTEKVLEKQADTMDLLATLDRIRGLLVDMYS
ncbi:MAG TPA: DUF327 family protein [bacterium]|nr:DUF327 family protein [bacterium]